MSDIQNKIDRITDILRRDDGISGAMHYTEQISWILFLKFLNDFEINKADEAVLNGKEYEFVIRKDLRWENWACPKDENGRLDVKRALTGSDLIEFVNKTLFDYLQKFKNNNNDPKSIKYKIGAIFEFLDNRIASGHTLREVLDIIDTLDFQSSDELFELSHIYENLLKGMGSDGGNSGEFYTPRAIIKAMVETVNPKVGETIYDGAVGSAGFLVEAFEYLTKPEKKSKYSASEWETIQTNTFFGQEKTSLGYVMGMMNMILHGIESPNVYKGNTLTQNIRDFQEKDRHNVILANPPFGGKEKTQIQQNFPIETNATEMLFIQHFMKMLKLEGRASIIIPEGVLFQTNNAFKKIKQDLLEGFNVHTIVSLPSGVFLPYSGVKTNILYFDRKGSTSKIWYYDLTPPYKLTKNKPISYEHLQEFVDLFKNPNKRNQTNGKSFDGCNDWTVSINDIIEYDISAKNPHKIAEVEHLTPSKILSKIKENDKKINDFNNQLEYLLNDINEEFKELSKSFKSLTLPQLVLKNKHSIKRGPFGSALKKSFFVPSGYKIYEQKNAIKNDFSIGEYYINEEKFKELEAFEVKSGDIIISCSGTIGKIAIAPPNIEKGIINQALLKISLDNNKILPEYFTLFFENFVNQGELESKGAAIKNIVSVAELKQIQIPVPNTISEQKLIIENIVKKRSLIDLYINETESKLNNLKGLKSSLLDEAFKVE